MLNKFLIFQFFFIKDVAFFFFILLLLFFRLPEFMSDGSIVFFCLIQAYSLVLLGALMEERREIEATSDWIPSFAIGLSILVVDHDASSLITISSLLQQSYYNGKLNIYNLYLPFLKLLKLNNKTNTDKSLMLWFLH